MEKKSPIEIKVGDIVTECEEGHIEGQIVNAPRPLTGRYRFEILTKIVVVLFLSGFMVFMITVIWDAATWKANTDTAISILKHNVLKLQENKGVIKPQSMSPKDNEKISSKFSGYVGLINEKKCVNIPTSFYVEYHLEYNVCECNESFEWNEMPYLGNFIEIQNVSNGLKTWCMVIGSFNDPDHPRRALLVSKKVSNQLFF